MSFLSNYTKISVHRCGVMACVGPKMGVRFEIDHDLQPLFPYLNTCAVESKYFNSPKRIQFILEGVQCTIYSHEIVAAAFNDEESARLFGDHLLAFLNDIYKKRRTLKPNYKTVEQLSPIDIYQLLPKTNCRQCGQESCLAFAAFLSKGMACTRDCPGFSEPIAQKAVYPIFDKDGNLSSTVELSISGHQDHLSAPDGLLTPRELEVLRILANGGSNSEIAESLYISQHTVKTHVTHIYDKLGVNDRAQAAVWAALHNIL